MERSNNIIPDSSETAAMEGIVRMLLLVFRICAIKKEQGNCSPLKVGVINCCNN
jgi:hypothetical protein